MKAEDLRNNQRGSVGIFFEMVVVVVFVFVLLFGVKSFTNTAKKADTYYPVGGSGTSTKTLVQPSGISITSKDAKSPVGVSVGATSSPLGSRGATAPAPVQIAYTDSGFSPATITLTTGSRTVVFVNKSKSMMWPLSSASPSPVFDAGYGINPGGSYTFTFSADAALTTYGFYNRLNLMHKGSIILK